MISIKKEKDCCGCGACSVACPQKCIEMKEGTLGHLFPSVDYQICISCGICNTVCPMLNQESDKVIQQKVFAAYAKNKDVRKRGSSGGMVETFSEMLLEKNYIIYGAAFDEKLSLKCTRAENSNELKILLKSKYLQSDLSPKYQEIKQYLDNGKNILFISTPCQVRALKLFLKKNYDNLITIDFFCHGVPSQKFFNECIGYDEKKNRIKIKTFTFREKKKNGSTPHYFSVNGGKPSLYFKSTFYMAFQKYICLRESCYDCIFAGADRDSDITIGDFHEIDHYMKGINRFDGVSTVIINSQKGNELFELVCDKLNYFEMDLNKLINDKVCFSGGTKRPLQRDDFIKSYNDDLFDVFVQKHLNIKKYRVQAIYYNLPKFMRRILKRVIGVK